MAVLPLRWKSGFAHFGSLAILISALGIGFAFPPATRAQENPSNIARTTDSSPEEAPFRERLRDYVARTTLVPMRDIQVVEFSAADAHGIRKAVVRLNNSQPPVTNVFYVTADGGEILRGSLDKLSSDPWSGDRDRLAPLVADAPATGPSDATVTLIEFGDFECPFCAQLNGELEQLRAAFPQSLRWVFKNHPLTKIHPWAQAAAIAGECAAAQSSSQFWKFEHLVYQHQQEIAAKTATQQLRGLAVQSGVAAQAYDVCIHSPETARRVQARIVDVEPLGITGTPTLFINGRKITGAVSLDSLKVAVETEVALTSKQTGDHTH